MSAPADGLAPLIERVSPDDLMLLACDVGPVPLQVGAVLVLDARPGFDMSAARAAIAERLAAVPRLRQRMVSVPLGCGRPIWVDDAAFDVSAHVRSVTCRPPGDDAALLETAAAITTQPLPWSRPLWSATFVGGLTGSRVAVVVVFHHVLADGIGGLSVLASLVDGVPAPQPAPFPRPMPSRRQLAADATRSRLKSAEHGLAAIASLPAAFSELNLTGLTPVARSTLNGPTGPKRSLSVVRTDLGSILASAHAHAATVNDVVLAAVTRAVAALLARRGEAADSLVASVMVGGRPAGSSARLGNHIGVMPVRLPAGGPRAEQLERIAAITRAHKVMRRGASARLLRPGFRTLGVTGLLRPFINRQRLVSIFVTNLRGPDAVQKFAGQVITDVLPVTLIAGNVTLSFGVMSYAGSLAVVIIADPARHPDLDVLTDLLRAELDSFRGSVAGRGRSS